MTLFDYLGVGVTFALILCEAFAPPPHMVGIVCVPVFLGTLMLCLSRIR